MDHDHIGSKPTRHLRMLTPPKAETVPRGTGQDADIADRFQDLVLGSTDLADFLTGFAGFSASLATGEGRPGLACAVTLQQRRRALLHAGSTPDARALGELQSRLGEGPLPAALEEVRTVVLNNVAGENRWPACTAALLAAGIHSALAVPLVLDQEVVAVIGFFGPAPDVFTEVVVRGAERHALMARKALMLAVRIASAVQLAQDLEEAMKSRTAIDLAVGIIMGQQRCSQDEAFAILTRAASNRNEKLRKVAAELVEHLSGSGARTHFEK